MFMKFNLLPLVAAVALSAATAAPSYANDCEVKLDAAMSKITSSGPMRATTKVIVNGRPEHEAILEYVPPTNTRIYARALLAKEELAKRKDLMALNEFKADGTTDAYVHIGADTYMGTQKDPDKNTDRLSKEPKALLELAQFTYIEYYYAKACSANRIEFVFNSLGPRANDKISDQRRAEGKTNGVVRVLPTGSIDLDASGRPVRMVREDEVPTVAEQEELKPARQMAFPGVDFPVIKSRSFDSSIVYDPAIKIEVPK